MATAARGLQTALALSCSSWVAGAIPGGGGEFHVIVLRHNSRGGARFDCKDIGRIYTHVSATNDNCLYIR
jgi:hypothetical protein